MLQPYILEKIKDECRVQGWGLFWVGYRTITRLAKLLWYIDLNVAFVMRWDWV